MSNRNIIRAWKDPVYRNSLSNAERAAIPANPAGSLEISYEELDNVAGGAPGTWKCSWICTLGCTWTSGCTKNVDCG